MLPSLDLHSGGGVHILFLKKFLRMMVKINECQTMLEEHY